MTDLIKPLVWHETQLPNVQRWTAAVMGKLMYEVGNHGSGGAYLMTNWSGLSHDVFPDYAAAKEAAQKDFEERITPHLNPVTQ